MRGLFGGGCFCRFYPQEQDWCDFQYPAGAWNGVSLWRFKGSKKLNCQPLNHIFHILLCCYTNFLRARKHSYDECADSKVTTRTDMWDTSNRTLLSGMITSSSTWQSIISGLIDPALSDGSVDLRGRVKWNRWSANGISHAQARHHLMYRVSSKETKGSCSTSFTPIMTRYWYQKLQCNRRLPCNDCILRNVPHKCYFQPEL